MDIPEDRGRGDCHIVLPRPLGCPQGHKEGLQSKVDPGRDTDSAYGASADRSGFLFASHIQSQKGIRDISERHV